MNFITDSTCVKVRLAPFSSLRNLRHTVLIIIINGKQAFERRSWVAVKLPIQLVLFARATSESLAIRWATWEREGERGRERTQTSNAGFDQISPDLLAYDLLVVMLYLVVAIGKRKDCFAYPTHHVFALTNTHTAQLEMIDYLLVNCLFDHMAVRLEFKISLNVI